MIRFALTNLQWHHARNKSMTLNFREVHHHEHRVPDERHGMAIPTCLGNLLLAHCREGSAS